MENAMFYVAVVIMAIIAIMFLVKKGNGGGAAVVDGEAAGDIAELFEGDKRDEGDDKEKEEGGGDEEEGTEEDSVEEGGDKEKADDSKIIKSKFRIISDGSIKRVVCMIGDDDDEGNPKDAVIPGDGSDNVFEGDSLETLSGVAFSIEPPETLAEKDSEVLDRGSEMEPAGTSVAPQKDNSGKEGADSSDDGTGVTTEEISSILLGGKPPAGSLLTGRPEIDIMKMGWQGNIISMTQGPGGTASIVVRDMGLYHVARRLDDKHLICGADGLRREDPDIIDGVIFELGLQLAACVIMGEEGRLVLLHSALDTELSDPQGILILAATKAGEHEFVFAVNNKGETFCFPPTDQTGKPIRILLDQQVRHLAAQDGKIFFSRRDDGGGIFTISFDAAVDKPPVPFTKGLPENAEICMVSAFGATGIAVGIRGRGIWLCPNVNCKSPEFKRVSGLAVSSEPVGVALMGGVMMVLYADQVLEACPNWFIGMAHQ